MILYTRDLFSERGFGGGHTPAEWQQFCDEHGMIDIRGGIAAYPEFPLAAVIRAYMLPALNEHQNVEVIELGTTGNPVRAVRIDGEDVTAWWNQAPDRLPRLTPSYVMVSMEQAAAVQPAARSRAARF